MTKAAGFLITAALLLPVTVSADEKSGAISVAAGAFDILSSEIIGAVQLEWHFAHRFPYEITPFAGGWITSKEDHYLNAGVQRQFFMTERVWLAPSFAIGGYNLRQGKSLGEDVEFQSRVEAGYRFNEDQSLAVQFAHVSNGGLDQSNPGSELLMLSYQHRF